MSLIISVIESEAAAWQDQTYVLEKFSWDQVATLIFAGKYLMNRKEGAFRFQFESQDDRVVLAISEEGKPNTIEMVMYEGEPTTSNYEKGIRPLLEKLGAYAVIESGTGNLAVPVANVTVSEQKIGEKSTLLADKDINEFVLLSEIIKQVRSNLGSPEYRSQAIGRNGDKTFFFEITRFDSGRASHNLDGLLFTEPESKTCPSISNGHITQVLWRDKPSNVNEETEQGLSVLAGIKSIYEPETTKYNDSRPA
ncbi:hypothetical protein [Ewingella americana]|uniref:Uncharacterized protein n=1 Tax=Ewingella americana TaxID=41202 RepID=A0A502GCN5_9GAMM|nr:hypothetical protein [Ewingella americana]TPG60037.1 hypothetical protein EAH77_15835 [Ewingella americana]